LDSVDKETIAPIKQEWIYNVCGNISVLLSGKSPAHIHLACLEPSWSNFSVFVWCMAGMANIDSFPAIPKYVR